MAKKQKKRRKIIKVRPISVNCAFCETKTDPDYKAYEFLSKYVSERGRVADRERSGNCAKHQRKMTTAIKRARHLGLILYA
ncbi:30S ribosomal protein S18 [Candidatus Microgenomates bacterium]|nr:30S ribosomal protein S18 [Candidatus Microgenomates bacterium]